MLTGMTAPTATVRAVEISDRDQWATLFRAYRDFYELAADEDVIDRVWQWIWDDTNEVEAFVATRGDQLVGIAHYRRFCRPSSGATGIYLDDLFTSPAVRGEGVGRALIGEIEVLAETEGRSVVRWITAESNTTARRLYDLVATATHWVTYDLKPGE
jgi:GNAT superfamily N-acetyltransferase